MTIETLQDLIGEGLSSYQIAAELQTSQTNVRYWLKKHKLVTNRMSGESVTQGKCSVCGKPLEKQQTKFCSAACKAKDHYERHKNDNTNTAHSQFKRGTERKAAVIKAMGGGCKECGYNKNMGALQFHHRDEKNFPLDIRAFSNLSLDRLLQEAKLCDVLCANCHAEHHYPQFEGWQSLTY